MSEWTPEIVGFMEDAAAFSPYFTRLASLVLRGLGSGSRVCDAGCGLGELSFAMARFGMRVDAVDKSPHAAAHVARLVAEEKRTHAQSASEKIDVHCCDFKAGLPSEGYDRLIFSLSASYLEALEVAHRAGARSIVVVNKIHERRSWEQPRGGWRNRSRLLSMDARPIVHDLDAVACDLTRREIDCRISTLRLDLPQPFRNLEAAHRYFALFRTHDYPNGLNDASLERLLAPTTRDGYRWVLPVSRNLALFEISVDQGMHARKLSEAIATIRAFYGRDARHSEELKHVS